MNESMWSQHWLWISIPLFTLSETWVVQGYLIDNTMDLEKGNIRGKETS